MAAGQAAGLDLPDEGRIDIDGRSLAAMTDDERTRLRRERIGFVFQAFHILPHMTVAQNILFGLHGMPREQAVERMRSLLRRVDLGDLEQPLAPAFSPDGSLLAFSAELDGNLDVFIEASLKKGL